MYQLNTLYGTGCEMPQGFGTNTLKGRWKKWLWPILIL